MPFRCIKLSNAWEPIEIISWGNAFNHVYIDEKATVLWTYPEKYKIRSQYVTWDYPAIIALKSHVRRRPEKRNVRPSLRGILMRDIYTCQYCKSKLTNSDGTRDHIIPESKGGPTTWTNLVACCRNCQDKKADKLPHECNMYPIVQPKAPLYSERFINMIRISSADERHVWRKGLAKLGLTNLLGE